MFLIRLKKIDTSEHEEDILTHKLTAKRKVKLKHLPIENSTALLFCLDIKSFSDVMNADFWYSSL